MNLFVFIACLFPVLIACLFARNLWLFRKAPLAAINALPPVSVLIPARDEAAGIAATLDAVLTNENIELEVVVLDDDSQDATAEIVASFADQDPRVRLIPGQPLPAGWCGKQFACQQLADAARHQHLLFMDADVRLTRDALRRTLAQFQRSGTDLLSGFPQQVVGTLGEAMLIPLIHVVLLCYLPFDLMRRTRMAGAAAGCGQLFLTTRDAYLTAGGHAAIRESLHDGITLPRAYRAAGLWTDLFDASNIARCRMYVGWPATWNGLLKNAHEGMAAPRTIFPATALLTMTTIVPPILAIQQSWAAASALTLTLAYVATALAYFPRCVCAYRYDRSWLSALLFPVSCVVFLALQWYALIRRALGANAEWRDRSYCQDGTQIQAHRSAA